MASLPSTLILDGKTSVLPSIEEKPTSKKDSAVSGVTPALRKVLGGERKGRQLPPPRLRR